jgi:hypothetical protein
MDGDRLGNARYGSAQATGLIAQDDNFVAYYSASDGDRFTPIIGISLSAGSSQ